MFNSLGHFANDGTTMFFPVIAAVLNQTVRSFSLIYVGIMSQVFNGASALLSPFVGNWADRRKNPGSLIGLGIFLLSAGLVGLFTSIVFLSGVAQILAFLVAALVAGFGSSFYHPISATTMRLAFTSRSRGAAMGVVGAAGGIGSTIYPSLFFLGATFLTNSGSLILLASIGFIVSLAIPLGLRGLKRQQEMHVEGRKPKIRDTLTRGLLTLTVITAIRSVSTAGVTAFLPTYIATQKGAGGSLVLGITLSIMYVGAIFGQLVFGVLLDKFDKRMILGVSSAGAALSTLGYVLTGGTPEVAFITLFGFFTFSNFPTLLTLASEYVPSGSSSLGNSIVWGFGSTGGSIIGPAVVTAIVLNSSSRLGPAFEIMAALGLVGALATPLIPKPKGSREIVAVEKLRDSHGATVGVASD